MYTDAQLRPSQAQSLAGAAATTTSVNVIDLLSPSANIGRGRPRRAFSSVTTAFTGGTSVQATFVQSPNADLSGGTVIATGPVVTAPTLGTKLMDVVIPDNTARFVGFQYTTVGTFTAGAVSSYVLADTDRQPYLPSQTGF